MSPRIKDIAKKAEVSPAAVSLALNNKSGLSNEVRLKIIDIANQLGYKSIPNNPFQVNEKKTIRLLKIATHGHIVNERHNPFITEYLEGIETETKKRKFNLEVSFYNKVTIKEIINDELGKDVSGFIVLGTELNAHELDFFTGLSTPIVFIDTYFPHSAYDCIDINNADGVFIAIQHLYSNGHRNIGLVKSSYETVNFKKREYGFYDAMEYFSLQIQKQFIASVDPAFDSSVNDFSNFLDETKTLPSAFFCMNDMIAFGCIKALNNHNYKVPENISIIGFDDLPSSSLSDPPLTSIRVSSNYIGRRAVEKLIEKIMYPKDGLPETIQIPNKLVIRQSVRQL
jgi:LacI family transcriptional regulator